MKLYKKSLNIILLIFLLSIIITSIFSETYIIKKFNNIEIKYNVSKTEQLLKLINKDIESTYDLNKDYAIWDDTYKFINDKNNNYIETILKESSIFKNFNIDLILFVNKDNDIVFQQYYNKNKKLSKKNINYLSSIAISNIKSTHPLKGLTKLDDSLLLMTAAPITDTLNSKTPNGAMIFIKFLTKENINKYHDNNTNFEIIDYKNLYNVIYKKNDISIVEGNDNLIQSYGLIKDIFNNNSFMLKLNITRYIYFAAKENIKFFLFVIFILGIFMSVLLIKILNELVLKRIHTIEKTLNYVAKTADLSVRLDITGNDEITSLNKNFNNMFDMLETSKEEIIENQKKYNYLFSSVITNFSYNKIVKNKDSDIIDFKIVEINNYFSELLNTDKENIIGEHISSFIPSILNENPILTKSIKKISSVGGKETLEEIYIEELRKWFSAVVYSMELDYFALLLTDITENKKDKEKILGLAYYDSLTGLSNRKKIIETINKTINNYRNKKFAVLFIDLDHFKSINDTLGHDVGDYVLEKVSARFKMLIGPNHKIGRLGGDEFIIVQIINSISDAEKLAGKICTTLNHPIKYKEDDLFIGASIGISVYPEDGKDTSTLMKNADAAMYAAKKNGGYKYEVYSRSMNERALDDLILENRLRRALEKNELLVYFQPIYHLKTSKIIAVESLVRWKFDNKIISPNQFIPLAKNIGEIANIDNWVLNKACSQCHLWERQNNNPLYVSANISFKQMKDKNFVDNVLNILKTTKLPPSYLCLEITEDEAMEDVDLSIRTLEALKKHGIKISLDDFGTGYSSLSYVTKLPIDNIKIDKSIIKNIHKDNKSLQIVKSIILMSKSLDINIIAEGVETIDQLEILQELNCDFIQGFYISEPLPIKTFENKFIR
ncbi:EAL domain-containing protein [Clostridium botulinum]|uniref:EAL domain-containing protein n=1 Tax=Clostridium botulinum TaxID=1491 RepID=UPI001A926292|nr:EAL domain-containing protein [Clostridium botulinum]MBO0523618.1 EAL domain-containing protein [Clostridium botulinum]MBO0532744.1 EAL domain-containing protein [Clostridium botulinum]MBO0546351.1 EAL domain-containing protein [Clostridium botulinum]MBO0579254.1 EAL domain-containing protein [Clostridium botulinum]